MKCYCNDNCIKTREEVLQNVFEIYEPCLECSKKTLKKAIPLKRQIKLENINKNYKKCASCGKRHIDIVMAHVLKILIENDQISSSSSIRKVGTPLITPAISLDHLPYLSNQSLVIITPDCNGAIAAKILDEVPEIKAIIKGDTDTTVGKLSENTKVSSYELLGGCDIRCDIQNTDAGPILLYKNQSKLHIEYPKPVSPKIEQLREILEKYDNPTVLDAMCGPGTLGIYSLLKNARHVVFNDIYDESLNALKTNLEVNNISEDSYEIYNEDVLKLTKHLDAHFDIGIIDTFPEIDYNKYYDSLEEICDEVIII